MIKECCHDLFSLQINGMIQRLNAWCTDVKSMEALMEEKAHEIIM